MAGLKLDGGNELLVHVKPDDRRSFGRSGEEYSALESAGPVVTGDYAIPVGPPHPPPPPPPLSASTSSSGDYNHSGSVTRHEIGRNITTNVHNGSKNSCWIMFWLFLFKIRI